MIFVWLLPMKSLKNPAVRGTLWTLLDYGVANVLRFGSNLILTRLLIPEYFGLMALVNTLRIGLELMSDLGIDQSIIQNKNGDDLKFLNTAWTLKCIRGIILSLACAAIAIPVANWYGDERLKLLIPIVGITSILDGLSSTYIATLNRQMALGMLTAIDMSAQVFSIATLVIWSWINPSIWALSLGSLSGPLFKLIATHICQWIHHKNSNRWQWDPESVAAIFHFGKSLFLATALMFLAEQADRFILGKLISFEMLGVYTIAATLSAMPREALKTLSHRVLFPTASRSAELPREDLRQKLLRQRWIILSGAAVGVSILAGLGDLVIKALYSNEYNQAAWMLPLLATGVWFSALFYTLSPSLMAVGQPIYYAYSNLGRLLFIGIGLQVGYTQFGLVGAILVTAFSDCCAYLVLLYGLFRERLLCWSQDLLLTLFFGGLLGLIILARQGLGFGSPIQGIWGF